MCVDNVRDYQQQQQSKKDEIFLDKYTKNIKQYVRNYVDETSKQKPVWHTPLNLSRFSFFFFSFSFSLTRSTTRHTPQLGLYSWKAYFYIDRLFRYNIVITFIESSTHSHEKNHNFITEHYPSSLSQGNDIVNTELSFLFAQMRNVFPRELPIFDAPKRVLISLEQFFVLLL